MADDRWTVAIDVDATRGESAVGSLNRGMSTLAVTAGTLLSDAIGRLGSALGGALYEGAIGLNSTLETTKLQFETLTGSSQRADEIVRDLFDFAKTTPFETGQIIEASRIMQTFGGDALNTKENLTLFGDAAAATGAPLEQVAMWTSRAFGAMAANQPVGEATNRLLELAVISPKVKSELEGLQKSGELSTKGWALLSGELQKYSGAMEKQAGTWSGLMSTLNDTVTMTIAQIGQPIFETLKGIIGAFNEAASSPAVTGFIDTVAEGLATGIATVIDVGRDFVAWLQSTGGFFESVYEKALPMVNVLQRVGDLAVTLVARIGADLWSGAAASIEPWKRGLDALIETFNSIFRVAEPIVTTILQVRGALVDAVASLMPDIWGAFASILGAVSQAIGLAADVVTPLLNGLLAILEPIGSALWGAFVEILRGALDAITAFFDVISGGLGYMREAVFSVAALGEALFGVTTELPKVKASAEFKAMATDSEAAKVAAGGLALAFGEVDKTGVVAGVTVGEIAGWTTKAGGAATGASKEMQKFADEVAKASGADKITGAQHLVDVINAAGVANMQAAGTAGDYLAKLDNVIGIASAQGKEIPKPWLDAAEALQLAGLGAMKYVTELPKIAQATRDIPPLPLPIDEAKTNQILTAMSGIRGATESTFNSAAVSMGNSRGEIDRWTTALGDAVVRAVEGGGSIAGALALAGSDELLRSLNNTKDGLGHIIDPAGALGETIKTATGAVQAMGVAFQVAEETGSKALGALVGGATGFMNVLASTGDPIKATIAGITGALGALFSDAEKQINPVREQFIQAAGGLTAIAEQARAAGTDVRALLDAKNPKEYEKAIGDLKAAFEAHKRELTNWGAELDRVMKNGSTLTRDLIEQTRDLFSRDRSGTTETLFDYLEGQIKNVSEGFNAATKSWATPLLDLAKNARDASDDLADLQKSGRASGDELKSAAERAERATRELATAVGENEDDFRRYGSIAIGTFEQLRESGLSVPEAFAAMRPGLEALATAAETLGYDAGDAFDELLGLAKVADEYQPAIDQIGALDKIVMGLHGSGLLTSSLFYDLAGQVADTFGDMVSGGADAESALRLVAPQVQHLWELQQDFGFEVDAATQALIDQGIEAGVVGDQYRDANDRMVKAVEGLINRLGDLIAVMTGGLPGAAATGAGAAAGSIDQIGEAARRNAQEANDAIGSINWTGLQGDGEAALGAIEDAGAHAAWGSSPTGIKEIGVVARLVSGDLVSLEDVAREVLGSIETGYGNTADSMAGAMAAARDMAVSMGLDVDAMLKGVAGDARAVKDLLESIGETYRESVATNLFTNAGGSAQDRAVQSLRAEDFRDWARSQAPLTQALIEEIAVPFKQNLINAITLKPEDMEFSNVFDYLARVQVDRYLQGLDASELETVNAVLLEQSQHVVVTRKEMEDAARAAEDMKREAEETSQALRQVQLDHWTEQYDHLSDLLGNRISQLLDHTKGQHESISAEALHWAEGIRVAMHTLNQMGEVTGPLVEQYHSMFRDLFVGGSQDVVDGFSMMTEGVTTIMDLLKEQQDEVEKTHSSWAEKIKDNASATDKATGALEDYEAAAKKATDAKKWDDVADAQQHIADTQAEINRLTEAGTTLKEQEREAVAAVVASYRDWTPFLQETFDVFGVLGEAAFAQARAAGTTYLQALMEIQPQLETLLQAQQEFGLTGGTAVQRLMDLGKVAEANKPVLQFVSGLDQVLAGLGNTASVTQDTFNAVTQGVRASVDALVDGGASQEQMLEIMAPTLQKVWEGWQYYRFNIDEATASLLTNAEAQGLIGETFMTAEERIAIAVEAMVEKLDVLLGKMMTIVPGAVAVADAIGSEIPAAASDAEAAVADMARSAVDDLGAIEDAAARAAWGSSPTGIKEISVTSMLASRDVGQLGQVALGVFGAIEGQAGVTGEAVETLTGQLLQAAALSGAIGGGGGGGWSGGGGSTSTAWEPPSAGASGSFMDTILRTIDASYRVGSTYTGTGSINIITDPQTGRPIDPYQSGFGGGRHFTPDEWARSMGVTLPQSYFDSLMARYGGPQHNAWDPSMMPGGAGVNADYVMNTLREAYRVGSTYTGTGSINIITDPQTGRQIDPYQSIYGARTGFTPQEWAASMGVTLPQSWYDEQMLTYGGPTHNAWEPDMMPRLARGGIVKRPTVALIGEAGPEAVVPLPGGSAIDYDKLSRAIVGAMTHKGVSFVTAASRHARGMTDVVMEQWPDAMRRHGARR